MMKEVVYKKYMLGLLLVILAFNYVDRQILALVLEDIKLELALTDSELGFLSGIAFALFYSLMGIPIARWADRGDRKTIISVTAALWAVMVALCGLATSFFQLMLARIGVAVGEAGAIPPAHSLIADYFTREERPRAVAIYMLGGSLSVVIGYFIGGWLNEFYGWRATFIILGLPGLVLSILAWFTLREPRQNIILEKYGISKDDSLLQAELDVQPRHESLKDVAKILLKNATFRQLLFGFAIMHFFSYGIFHWVPTFFIRSHGMTTGELGTWLAIVWGIGGAIGVYLGGELASRYAANNERLQLQMMTVIFAFYMFLNVLLYLSPNKYVALGLTGISTLIVTTSSGPMFAIIQTLVHERMRATAIALLYLVANLIGMGFGPLLTGVLSDILEPYFGNESLRYALVLLCPGWLWMAVHFWFASKTVMADLPISSERKAQD